MIDQIVKTTKMIVQDLLWYYSTDFKRRIFNLAS